jgi:hypothetical protein
VCCGVSVSMCEYVGRVQCVCIESVQEFVQKRVNAGNLVGHLKRYFAVLFSSLLT